MISWVRGVPVGKCVDDSRKRLVLGRRLFIAINIHAFGPPIAGQVALSDSEPFTRAAPCVPARPARCGRVAHRPPMGMPRLLVRCEESRCTRLRARRLQ